LESLFDRTINLPEINQSSNMEVLA
ncbi:hypothetical protein D046_5349B, partial [Vibrio parahaemolyticus V-223/04]